MKSADVVGQQERLSSMAATVCGRSARHTRSRTVNAVSCSDVGRRNRNKRSNVRANREEKRTMQQVAAEEGK